MNNEIFSWVISSGHVELEPTLFYLKMIIQKKRTIPKNNNVPFNLDHLKEAVVDCTQDRSAD